MTTDHWLEVSHTFTSFSHNRPIRGNCSNKRPPIIVSLPFSLSLFFCRTVWTVESGRYYEWAYVVGKYRSIFEFRRGPWPLGSSQLDAEFITVVISSRKRSNLNRVKVRQVELDPRIIPRSRVKLVGWKSWATLRIENKVRSRKLHSRNVFCQTWIV